MKQNRSQYAGTLKDSKCTFCGKELNNLNRVEQDKHAKTHEGQKKLI